MTENRKRFHIGLSISSLIFLVGEIDSPENSLNEYKNLVGWLFYLLQGETYVMMSPQFVINLSGNFQPKITEFIMSITPVSRRISA